MFYLTKRTRIDDCKVGDRVMVLSDYPGGGIEAGAKGTVSEVAAGNVQVTWDHKNGFGDGFAADELEFLAFGTESHPGTADSRREVALPDNVAMALSCLEDATTDDFKALWNAMQDRTEALLPFDDDWGAHYLKIALGLVGGATFQVQRELTDKGAGPRDVVLTIAPARVLHAVEEAAL